MKKGDVVGLISIIVVLGGIAVLFALAPKRSEIAFAPIEVAGSALVLDDAQESGVVVDVVMGVEIDGFITLHKAVTTAPGPLVASSDFLDEGIYSELFLEVPGGLDPQETYIMLMVADDGDGVYEPGVDRPVMVNGEVIRVFVELSSSSSTE